MGDNIAYLKEGTEVKLTYFGTEPLDVEMPTTVDFEVVESEAAVRGDTATGVNKKVKVDTGFEFVCQPSSIMATSSDIDTRTGEYVTRVQINIEQPKYRSHRNVGFLFIYEIS